jgi:hypothetical protein
MAGIYSETAYSRAIGWLHGRGAYKGSCEFYPCSLDYLVLTNILQVVALVLRDKLLPQFFLRRYD